MSSTRDARSFVAWMFIGAGFAFSVLAALSIGVFILPVVIAVTVLAARRTSIRGRIGLVSGLGLPLLYVAWLNREGPGTICHATATGESCGDQYSPWPWTVLGLLLVAAGAAWFWRSTAAPTRQRQ